jgi:hypothetical protein
MYTLRYYEEIAAAVDAFSSFKFESDRNFPECIHEFLTARNRVLKSTGGTRNWDDVDCALLIHALPASYGETISIILMSRPVEERLTVGSLCDLICRYAPNPIAYPDIVQSTSGMNPLAKTLEAAVTRNNKKRKRNCNHCGRSPHSKVRCWVLHPELRPKRLKGAKTRS